MKINTFLYISLMISAILLSLSIDWRPFYDGLNIHNEVFVWAVSSCAITLVIFLFTYKNRKNRY